MQQSNTMGRVKGNQRIKSRIGGKKQDDKSVSVNLYGNEGLSEEIFDYLRSKTYELYKDGVGDDTIHNTALYLLASSLGLPTQGIFNIQDIKRGLVLDLPAYLNERIDLAADVLNITKREAIIITLEKAMRTQTVKLSDQKAATGNGAVLNLANLKSIGSFAESNPNVKKKNFRQEVYSHLPGKRYDNKERFPDRVILQPINIDGTIYIDTTRYRITDNGSVEEIKP